MYFLSCENKDCSIADTSAYIKEQPKRQANLVSFSLATKPNPASSEEKSHILILIREMGDLIELRIFLLLPLSHWNSSSVELGN